MGDALRVYIVADFEPLRAGLAKTVTSALDMEVVGEASSLEEMAYGENYRQADVLVVDMQALKRTDRDAMYKRLQEWIPAMKVLFLGSSEDAAGIGFDSLPQAMHLHTIGFLLKDGGADRLIRAIRMVASGAFVCETEVIRRILIRLTQWASYTPMEQHGHLSEREIEVLTMVTQGRSNKEIARELVLSEGTVKAHVSHIMSKLGLDRRTELVRYALTKGLLLLGEE